ncbi:unnamed protein product [Lepidochelys kempii]
METPFCSIPLLLQIQRLKRRKEALEQLNLCDKARQELSSGGSKALPMSITDTGPGFSLTLPWQCKVQLAATATLRLFSAARVVQRGLSVNETQAPNASKPVLTIQNQEGYSIASPEHSGIMRQVPKIMKLAYNS